MFMDLRANFLPPALINSAGIWSIPIDLGWREINQQYANNQISIIKLISQHHYAHHQENKTVYYCICCSALVVLAVVVWSWVVSCVHCVKVTVRTVTFTQCTQLTTQFYTTTASTTSAHSLRLSSTKPQPAQPVQNTICSNTQSCSPDDGQWCTKHVEIEVW